MRKYLLLLYFFFINIPLVLACNLSNYNQNIKEGNDFLQKQEYVKAILSFKKAYHECYYKAHEIDAAVLKTLKRAELEGKDLKEIYISFKTVTPKEKMFYTFDFESNEYKCALVKYNKKYHFIDTIGRKISKLQEWEKASDFYRDGFTEVIKDNNTYLLDTLGKLYLYAKKEGNLTPETIALDIAFWESTNIPEEVFDNKQLEILDFSDNKIETITDDIAKLENLKVLIGYTNKISKISDKLDNLQQLEVIELSENNIKYLPQSFFKLKKLKYAYFDKNNIKEVSKDIKNLDNIIELDLSENKIIDIPIELYQLKKMEDLNLSSNKIKELSPDIEHLKDLLSLDLHDNQIDIVPDNITKLKKIIFLDLSYNKIKFLPNIIADMKTLRKLYLIDNPINNEEKDRIRKALPNCLISFENKNTEISELAKNKKFVEAYNLSLSMTKDDSTDYHRWFDLSWRALFVNKPEIAIQAANKSLSLNHRSEKVITNLVLGYLLSNQWYIAKSIYDDWKGKKFKGDERLSKDVFLKDIEDLEKAGIKHQDFIKAKQLLLLSPR